MSRTGLAVFLARSAPNDVARVEDRTFICSLSKDAAGPTNNWMDPFAMRKKLKQLFRGCMRGRTMYVLPFSMGPVGGPMSRIGVQLTDSEYAVVNMRIMCRVGTDVLREIDKGEQRVVPCMHSVGAPLAPGQADVPWPCNDEKYIVHFPETREIWSYGSGYGGNALLGKKCFALRIASNIARDEGWMAEHMLLVACAVATANAAGVTEKTYVAAAFPSACGKTNFAMMVPPEGMEQLEGAGPLAMTLRGSSRTPRTSCCGPSTRRWASSALRQGPLPRHNPKCNGDAAASNTIFTNVAETPDGGVWWEGMTDEPPGGVHRLARPGAGHQPSPRRQAGRQRIPNGRFTAHQHRSARPWTLSGRIPCGVPISAIHVWRPAVNHDAAHLPGLQLELRRICWRNHGL